MFKKIVNRRKHAFLQIEKGKGLFDKFRLIFYFILSNFLSWRLCYKFKVFHNFMNFIVKGIRIESIGFIWEIGHYRDFVTVEPFYEAEISDWFDYEGDVFLDIGAYVGRYCILLNQRFRTVYAFEPASETYHSLIKNIALNKIRNIITYKVALMDKTQKMRMNIKYAPGTNSLKNSVNFLRFEYINAIRLDDFNISGKIDLIKVDIEGAEKEFLLGGKETIIKNRPRLIIEVEKRNLKFVNNFMKNIGYKETRTSGAWGGVYRFYESDLNV